MFTVYILFSTAFNKIYVGQTNNISNRLVRHNKGMVPSTKRYKPWIVIHSENYESRIDAMKREKFLKSGQGREFIKGISKNISRKVPEAQIIV